MQQTKFTFVVMALLNVTISPVFAQPTLNADAKSVEYLNKFSGDYLKSIQDNKPEMIQDFFWKISG